MTQQVSSHSSPAGKPAQVTAVQVVWQWVTYGLWQWTLAALSVLLSATLTYLFVDKTGDYEFTIYALAAVLCLLPLAFVADMVTRKHEQPVKHGFSAVVMVLNAVLVFLATVAALITAVVSMLSAVINVAISETTTITIISALVVTVLGALLFVRIVNPQQIKRYVSLFPWIVVGVTGLTVILAVVAPLRSLITTRQDRIIEDNLTSLSYSIERYTNANAALPKSLDDLTFDEYEEGSRKLVERKLVTYKPGDKRTQPTKSQLQLFEEVLQGQEMPQNGYLTFTYELCATYQQVKGNGTRSNDLWEASMSHPAGKVCYDQEVEYYGKS